MKSVLITGGSRGIGRAMVELFSKEGYKVAFTYNSSAAEAEELSRKTGAIAIKADCRDSAQIAASVAEAARENGDVDILINNAGISSYSLFCDITESEWREMFDVTVTSAFLYSKAVFSGMLKKKCGRIINISSMWGLVGASLEVHYSAAKAALIGFTKALAKELGPSGITVNAIAPGVIDTDMNSSLTDEARTSLIDETPLCRIGEPMDIARAALFLSSDGASFITGEIMNISGGFVV